MNETLRSGVIADLPEPFTYRVRLADGREVVAIPSRFHFEHTPEDIARIKALQPTVPVTVRLAVANPGAGWVVRVAETEDAWRKGRDPATLLETVRERASARKLRLFACACCRRIGELIPEGPHRALLDVVEAFADGQARAEDLTAALAAGDAEERRASDRAEDAEDDPRLGPELAAVAKAIWASRSAAQVGSAYEGFEIALDTARSCAEAVGLRARAWVQEASPARQDAAERERAAAEEAARSAQAELVRELFGNPFHPVQADVRNHETHAVELARGIYTEGRLEQFAQLAAALQAAEYTDGEVMNHCRAPRTHVRGCWVLDLLLGQT